MKIEFSPENELRRRINEHLEARPDQEKVVLSWYAYLAALLEWSIIDGNVYDRLLSLLPKIDAEEVVEILVGVEFVDTHPERFSSSKPSAKSCST